MRYVSILVFLLGSLTAFGFETTDETRVIEVPQNSSERESEQISRAQMNLSPDTIENLDHVDPAAARWLMMSIETLEHNKRKKAYSKWARKAEREDRKKVNQVIKLAVRILESSHGGLGSIRVAANYLNSLIDLHQKFFVGSPERLQHIAHLETQVKAALAIIKTLPNLKFEGSDLKILLEDLGKEGFHAELLEILEAYYLEHKFSTNSYGARIGAAILFGGEVGGNLGIMTDALGKQYVAPGFEGSVCLGLGPIVSLSHSYGHYSKKGEVFDTGPDEVVFLVGGKKMKNGDRHLDSGSISGLLGTPKYYVIKGRMIPIGHNWNHVQESLGIKYTEDRFPPMD